MCEILVLKHNSKDLFFTKEAIEDAFDANNDGAGYALFQKLPGNKYDLVEVKQLNKPVVTNVAKRHALYTDFEFDWQDKKIILTNDDGGEIIMNYPKDIGLVQNMAYYDQKKAVETWLKETKIKFNFDYIPKDPVHKYQYDELGIPNQIQLPIGKPAVVEDSIVETLYKKQFELQPNQMLIMHFRMATVGYGKQNTQPIVTDDFVTIHNGVFSNLGNVDKSDTHEFTTNLETIYRLAHLKTAAEEENFISTFMDITQGWYSAFIYSIKSKKLYYFKHNASFYSFANGLMYSTKDTRFPITAVSVTEFK